MRHTASIVLRDVRRWHRMRRVHLLRSIVAGTAGVLVIGGLIASSRVNLSAMGLEVFYAVCLLLLLVACFVSPWQAAPAFASERQDRTLELLLLTNLSPLQVAVGKLGASMICISTAVLSGLPSLFLCVSIGGVSAAQVTQGVVVLLCASFSGASLGLLSATLSTRGRFALFRAAVYSLLIYVAIPAALLFRADVYEGEAWSRAVLSVVSPFACLQGVFEDAPLRFVVAHGAFSVFLGMLFLCLSAVRVASFAGDPCVQAPARKPRLRRSRMGGRGGVVRRELIGYPRPALVWLSLFATAIFCLAISRADYLVDIFDEFIPWWLNSPEWGVALVGSICALVSATVGALRCALSFSAERRAQALEMLLLSDLTPDDIILGKLWAPAKHCLPWTITASLCVVLLAGEVNGGIAHSLLLAAAFTTFLASAQAFALYLSLRTPAGAAVGVAVLVAALWGLVAAPIAFVDTWSAGIISIVQLYVLWFFVGKLFFLFEQISSGDRPLR